MILLLVITVLIICSKIVNLILKYVFLINLMDKITNLN